MLFLWLTSGVLLALEELGLSSGAWTDSWGARTEQAVFPSKHGHPWHHRAALSSPTLCHAGAIPASPSA